MNIIGWILFGLVVGAIAKFLMPGRDPGGWIVTILLGIAGSYFGGLIGWLLIGGGGADVLNGGGGSDTASYFNAPEAVIANLITVAACFALLDQLAKITTVRAGVLIPALVVLIFIGSYTSNNHYGDLLVTLVFGALGYLMVLGGWPRAPFVLGLVLGKIAESYLYISVARYEAAWLTRPVVLVLFALAVGVVVYPLIQSRRTRA